MTTAEEMAKQAGVDPKAFRQALRNEKFPWHEHYARWTVEINSDHYEAMQRVLKKVTT